MFCRSDSRLCADMVSDGAIGKTCVPRGLTLRQANAGNDMKNILYIWFSHCALTETHRWYNYSLSLYFNKKQNLSRVDPFAGNIETVSKLLDCDRTIQNDVDIDTYHCKPELIAWR